MEPKRYVRRDVRVCVCDVPELTIYRPGMEDKFINYPSYRERTWDNGFEFIDEQRKTKHPDCLITLHEALIYIILRP